MGTILKKTYLITFWSKRQILYFQFKFNHFFPDNQSDNFKSVLGEVYDLARDR